MLIDGPATATNTLVLAHGAGAPMDSDFMNDIARGVSEHGIRVVRFEFPYMAQRRVDGKRRGPGRADKLLDYFELAVRSAHQQAGRLFIGGKSMGARVASMVADRMEVAGLVCLGYPFHPPARPDNLRTAHLKSIKTRTLIVQGERDPFGTATEIEQMQLPPAIELGILQDGDHSFKPRKKSGRTEPQARAEAVELVAAFVHR